LVLSTNARRFREFVAQKVAKWEHRVEEIGSIVEVVRIHFESGEGDAYDE
jgi:hypothetical protein